MPGGKGVFPTLTVGENFQLAAWRFQKDPDYVDAMTSVLRLLPGAAERWDQKAGNLSGGEQQMLTLGQALICKPKLLMIDELSLGLAPVIVEQLLGIVREIHAKGTTVVLVEQSVNVAITLAERADLHGEGRGALRRPHRRSARASRHPARRVPQGRRRWSVDTGADKTAAKARKHFVAECKTCGHEHKRSARGHW